MFQSPNWQPSNAAEVEYCSAFVSVSWSRKKGDMMLGSLLSKFHREIAFDLYHYCDTDAATKGSFARAV